jgi:uncharacterized Tic20 family protein
MGYCVSCAKDVKSAKFCPTCGRQLLSSADLKAEATAAEKISQPTKAKTKVAVWVHLSPIIAFLVSFFLFVTLFLCWLPGLLVRNSSTATEFDKRHATESMNFQLTMLIFTVPPTIFTFATAFVGLAFVVPAAFILGPPLLITSLIFMIMGAVAANDGREFRYPLSIRFVK